MIQTSYLLFTSCVLLDMYIDLNLRYTCKWLCALSDRMEQTGATRKIYEKGPVGGL